MAEAPKNRAPRDIAHRDESLWGKAKGRCVNDAGNALSLVFPQQRQIAKDIDFQRAIDNIYRIGVATVVRPLSRTTRVTGYAMAISKKRKVQGKRRQLSKADLLPLPVSHVRAVSLRSHVALQSLRNAQANVEHVADLLKTVYLCYLLNADSLASDGLETLVEAESALKRALDSIVHGETTALSRDEGLVLVAVLEEADRLMTRTPKAHWNHAHTLLLALYEQSKAPSLRLLLEESREAATLQ